MEISILVISAIISILFVRWISKPKEISEPKRMYSIVRDIKEYNHRLKKLKNNGTWQSPIFGSDDEYSKKWMIEHLNKGGYDGEIRQLIMEILEFVEAINAYKHDRDLILRYEQPISPGNKTKNISVFTDDAYKYIIKCDKVVELFDKIYEKM